MSGPEPTWPSVQPRARPRRRSSAASSDTSPVRSTGSSLPRPHIAPRFQGLDEHRSITSAWKGDSQKFAKKKSSAFARVLVGWVSTFSEQLLLLPSRVARSLPVAHPLLSALFTLVPSS